MSVFGDGIIERLHEQSRLRNTSNPVRKILDSTVGEWLDKYHDSRDYNQFFITDATGDFLDCFGKDYGVPRNLGEDDTVYRERIFMESANHLTVPYLKSVYDVTVLCNVKRYDPSKKLTSDNPYLSSEYIIMCSEEVKQILTRKFFMEGVVWVIL